MPPPHKKRVPSSAIGAFIDPSQIDALLSDVLPDDEDRAWVLRCILDEGPAHHRGANFILLSLLGRVLERLPAGVKPDPSEEAPVPIRMPPHHRHHHHGPHHERTGDDVFPLGVPIDVLAEVSAERRDVEPMLDCLTDGPPQHALANAAMIHLLRTILQRLDAPAPATPKKKAK